MKLLLIDDDDFLRDMYAMKFKEDGYEVEVADSAVAALRMIEKNQDIGVVLLDMIMPGMTGLELMRVVKDQFPNFEAKFIVLSNQGQAEDVKKATGLGAVGYIIKAESIPSDVVKKVEILINK